MEIRPVSTLAAGPQAPEPTAPAPPREPPPQALDPPVKVEIGTGAGEARFVRDRDTRTMVFQVVDPGSGDVIVQSPTVTVLRNRAYDASLRAARAEGGVTRVA